MTVNDPYFDNQHKEIMTKLAEIEKLCSRKNKKDEIISVYTDLIDILEEHLRDEELFMEDNNYDIIDAHKKLHQELMTPINGVLEEFKQGKINGLILKSLLGKIALSLHNHIINYDIAMMQNIRENTSFVNV